MGFRWLDKDPLVLPRRPSCLATGSSISFVSFYVFLLPRWVVGRSLPVIHCFSQGEAEWDGMEWADGIASSQRQRKVNHQMANASLG